MANEKISQLAAGAPAQSTDLLLIARSGTSLSLQVSDISALGGGPTGPTGPTGTTGTGGPTGPTGAPGTQPFDLGFYFEGVFTNAEAVARYVFNRSVSFVANLTGSHASADTASTGTVSFTLKQNGSSVGTVTFTASATGTFTFASPVTFAAGDVLNIVAPATADGTLADVAINLAGTR